MKQTEAATRSHGQNIQDCILQTSGLKEIHHDENAAGLECLTDLQEHLAGRHMMQRSNRGNAIELSFRQRARHDVVNLKIDTRKCR